MLKILQARLQQYVNRELPDVQAGFRKGRRIRDQIANIAGSSKKQESSRKTSISDYSHEIKRHLLLGRKVMTNLDGILKK